MIALFTGIAAKAQAEVSIPAALQGNWASPDCGNYTEGVILTRGFYLKSTEGETAFGPVSLAGGGRDYKALNIAGNVHPVMRTEDSLLKIGNLEGFAPDVWPKTWDELALDGRNEYTGCPEAPAVIPVPLIHVMGFIDEMKKSCAVSVTQACRKLLFSIADSNKNKKISPAEIKKLGAMLFVFAPLAGGGSISTPDLEAAYKAGMDEGEKAADALLSAYDGNHSGDLDEKELRDISPALTGGVRDALTRLSALLPPFAAAAR